MREFDGMVYSDDAEPVPRVASVEPFGGRWLNLTFATGQRGRFDMAPLLGKGVFRALQTRQVFDSVALLNGAPTWLGGEVDLDPEYLLDSLQ
ncbi:MAG: DUF2442 domain-containing protein [Bifidobacteriaceae bacterium]|jgi:hypothetical protein|nr:DUF2442 domain-containing protein [Bifidobacteriaceae bacterium]